MDKKKQVILQDFPNAMIVGKISTTNLSMLRDTQVKDMRIACEFAEKNYSSDDTYNYERMIMYFCFDEIHDVYSFISGILVKDGVKIKEDHSKGIVGKKCFKAKWTRFEFNDEVEKSFEGWKVTKKWALEEKVTLLPSAFGNVIEMLKIWPKSGDKMKQKEVIKMSMFWKVDSNEKKE